MIKSEHKPKIISFEEGMKLIGQGYFALDPHCHSSYSYDVPDAKDTSPESIIRQQKLIGLKPILTDHNTINGYDYLKRKGYDIIPAMELTFKPKIARKIFSYKHKPIQTLHINIFGLHNNDMEMIREITQRGDLDELIKYFRQNDLDWTYNHPFYHEKKEHLNWKVIPGLAQNYFDVVELNSTYSKGLNDIAQRFSNKLDKGIVASSDSHTGNPGQGFVIAEGKNFKDFWENVKNGESYIVRKDMGTWDIVREASRMMNQAFRTRKRPYIGRTYTPSTTVQPFDELLKSVSSGKLRNTFITKKIIQMMLQSINYTAVPLLAWRLHVTKDEEKADRIRHRMHAITNKMIAIKRNIKPVRKNIIKQTYYDARLIKNSTK
jgi:predicted metal-dependent phosphoesterase TrpH